MVAEFNVYCAICCCPLGGSCEVGSTNPWHLKLRRARVARRTYSRRTGSLYYETDEEEEDEKEERLSKMPWLRETAEADVDEDTASVNSDDYDHSYDPDVISPEDLSWLNTVFALGIAHRKPGPRTYMLCDCYYDDRNRVYIHDTGINPDDSDEQSRYFAYGVSDLTDPPVFPVHWECIVLLSRAIGISSVASIQKNVLYDVMLDLADFSCLNLSYGDITGPDQDWQCIPGEEYSVVCPTLEFDMGHQIIVDFEAGLFESQKPLELGNKVIKDPFTNMPYDVIYLILQYLPGDSIMALNRASWAILTLTRSNSFWKNRLAGDMVWLWELQQYFESPESSRVRNYKSLYLWLDKKTQPLYGLTGTFMGIANRRRIWGPCTELAERYHRKLHGSLQ